MADHNVVPIGIGHNFPPEDAVLDPLEPALAKAGVEALRARMLAKYAALFERFAELELGAPQIPKVIADEATAVALVNYVAQQGGAAVAEARKGHAEEKKPFLEVCRMFDALFLRRIERFVVALAPVKKAGDDYLRRKEIEQRQAEEQRRQQAAAAARQAEAERARLETEAKKKLATGDRPAANKLQAQANQAGELATRESQIASAPSAPVSVKTDEGATLYFVSQWRFEIEDPAALPEGLKMPDYEAIQARIDRGVREIPGVKIWFGKDARWRRC